MGLSHNAKLEIEDLLLSIVRAKIKNYSPETTHMPFHYGLLGKDRYAIFSFIHSINTTFGMSIWEQVAVILAKDAGSYGERQYRLLGTIDNDTENIIQEIYYMLRKGKADSIKYEETERIRGLIKKGDENNDPDSTVDVFIKEKDLNHYIDITSAKPNMKEFASLKLKLLRWTALSLSQDKNADVMTMIAIPYNPYHPEPYDRWTLKGLFDLKSNEILVGEEFWNYIACDNIYDELLDLFNYVGKTLRPEIDNKFADFK